MSGHPPEIDLPELQRWLQTLIASPEGITAGDMLHGVILPGPKQSAAERVAVYSHAYWARLLDCLRELFPATASALGIELFASFGAEYLARHPSRSYTLARLGDAFPDFLAATRPERAAESPDWADLLVDLARLELAIQEVFDGPGEEEAPAIDWSPLAQRSPERWLATRLVPNPSLRIVALRFPLNDYFTALRHGGAAEIPAPTPSWLALWRRDYLVRRLPLDERAAGLLAALAGGSSIGDALESLDVDAEELSRWFRDWAAAGFFIGWE